MVRGVGIEDVRIDVLACFYQLYNADYQSDVEIKILYNCTRRPIKVIEFALERLEQHGLVKENTGFPFETSYSLTAKGYEEAHTLDVEILGSAHSSVDNFLNALAIAREHEARSEEEAFASLPPEIDSISHFDKDDVWEPLPLDRNSSEYSHAVEALENAAEAVRGSNGLAQDDPASRDEVVSSLENGISDLKHGSPSKEKINALIVQPLRWVIKKCTDTSVAELAKIALAKIIDLLPL